MFPLWKLGTHSDRPRLITVFKKLGKSAHSLYNIVTKANINDQKRVSNALRKDGYKKNFDILVVKNLKDLISICISLPKESSFKEIDKVG